MTTKNRDDPEIPIKYREYQQECHSESGRNFDNKTFNDLFEKELNGSNDNQEAILELPCLSFPYRVIEPRDTFKHDKLFEVPKEEDFPPLLDMSVLPTRYSDIKFQKIEKIFDDPTNFDINEFNSKFEKYKASTTESTGSTSTLPMCIFGSSMEGAPVDLSLYRKEISTISEDTTTRKSKKSLLQDKKFLNKLLDKPTPR